MERNLKFYLWMVRNLQRYEGKKDVISLEPGQKAKIEVVFKKYWNIHVSLSYT